MGYSKKILSLLGLLTIFATFVSPNIADEVIFDRKAKSKITVGGFDCSQCPKPSSNMFSLFDGNTSELTAGELWTYFDSQGVSSLNQLTLCLDVPTNGDSSAFGINSMELKIEDPSQLGNLLTDVSLGDNSLVFAGYDITLFKPEAKLEIDLGYDFMKRFSAESKEKISLDVSSDGDGRADAQPVFSIEGAAGFFAKRFNTMALTVFAIFWAIVFIALNRFTKPKLVIHDTKANRPAPSNQRALSA